MNIYVSVYVYVLCIICIYPNQQDPCFLSGLPVNLGFTYGFGPGNPGFWENPMFFQTRDETVMDPWFTSDNPWNYARACALNASKKHPVVVGVCCVFWNRRGLWLLVFRNKAPRLDASKKYLGQSCETLGFVWKPWVSQLTLRLSRVLLARVYIYIYWLVVWNIFCFSIYWEFHHPNWLSYFSEG